MAFDPEAARPIAQSALRLLAVADDVAAAYEAEKRAAAAMDFTDLLIRARDLLTGPHGDSLRQRLAAQTRLLLVDEFQDTDPLQVDLVKALCDGRFTAGKLFLVGDKKQSIYRFRGADPDVFCDLRQQIPVEGRLPLSENFRSQPAVLEFINALFAEELEEPDQPYEPLKAVHKQVGPRPAVELLWAIDAEAAPSLPTNLRSGEGKTVERLRRREADFIARRIRGLLDSGEKIVWEKEGENETARPVCPGDIAILFRALTDVAYYEEALRRWDIDYYLVGGHAFYAQQEIYDVANLLRSLANPGDEVSLAGVLRSPLFALLDETLFWLARQGKGLSAGLFAEELSPELDAEQAGRVRAAAATLGAAGHEGPRAHRGVAPGDAGADRLRRRAAGRIPRPAETGQPQEARGPGAELRPRGPVHARRLHHRAFAVHRPAARRAAGGYATRDRRRCAADERPPGQGTGVSRGRGGRPGPAASRPDGAGGLHARARADDQGFPHRGRQRLRPLPAE